jgi:hypothetical protein
MPRLVAKEKSLTIRVPPIIESKAANGHRGQAAGVGEFAQFGRTEFIPFLGTIERNEFRST